MRSSRTKRTKRNSSPSFKGLGRSSPAHHRPLPGQGLAAAGRRPRGRGGRRRRPRARVGAAGGRGSRVPPANPPGAERPTRRSPRGLCPHPALGRRRAGLAAAGGRRVDHLPDPRDHGPGRSVRLWQKERRPAGLAPGAGGARDVTAREDRAPATGLPAHLRRLGGRTHTDAGRQDPAPGPALEARERTGHRSAQALRAR